MDGGLLQAFLDWISAHPRSAGIAVALIAFTESLVLVGLIMPGAALLFGVGALIAVGALPLGSTLVWATLGAIAGDWLSFFVGRYYERPLRQMWPLRNHPELIERGLRFIDRHGGKSLFFGRFVGPVRPIVPAVAGMLRMNTRRFLIVSTTASLLWAPTYLLPGAIFGASLGLASEVSGSLALLILILVALVWISIVLVRWLYRRLQPHAIDYLNRVAIWGTRHPLLSRFTRGLIDPERPDAGALAAWAALLLIAVWGFSSIMSGVLESLPPTAFDRAIYDNLQGLRTPWMDDLMIRITHLGDITLVAALATLVTLWLAAHRRWTACAHWLGAVVFALAVPWLLKMVLAIPRPEAIAAFVSDPAFPSGHTTRGVTLFGFLAVLTARDFSLNWRWLPYTIALLLSLGIAASRLYLGAHWLSDALGGITLGLIWVTVLGIGFRRHDSTAGRGRRLGTFSLALLLVGGALYSSHFLPQDRVHYAVRKPESQLTTEAWLSDAWRQLPRVRNDLRVRHNHPFTLQWAGELEPLTEQLESAGWRTARPLTWRDTLLWLGVEKENDRPILPQIHDGAYAALTFWRPAGIGNERIVLRLWRVPYHLTPGETALYAGNASRLKTIKALPAVVLPRTAKDFDGPLDALMQTLAPLVLAEVQRRPFEGAENTWSGRVLLAGHLPTLSLIERRVALSN